MKNTITLFIEVFKTTRRESPNLMNKIFSQKRTNNKLKKKNLISCPKVTEDSR